jgi:hypothetical protein
VAAGNPDARPADEGAELGADGLPF